jgi:hypothetical protein
MFQLNRRAFEILKAEIERRCAKDPAGPIQQDIALRRLDRLCSRPGQPFTFEELQETLKDLFPDFSEAVLRKAARANRPTSPILRQVKFAAIALVGITGGIWVLNLPYPMIRYPVARTVPIVLLPSFISMDSNYRQAIALTEQADQLVNQATSAADLDLGTTKVKAAQKHLDALPVWFLGYYPNLYCSWFQCGWQFTLDEFQQARKNVARMQARLFQETNAQTQLNAAELALNTAKQEYRSAPKGTQQQSILTRWQQAIDDIRALPPQTLAGRSSQTKLIAYERDFQQVAGLAAGQARSGGVIEAAILAGETAQKFSAKPVQSQEEWQEAVDLWQAAIARLNMITLDDPDYVQAQKQLQQYQSQLSASRIRLEQERNSVQAYDQAQTWTQDLLQSVSAQSKTLTPNQVSQLQRIITELKKVKPGTTVYQDAQKLLTSAQKKLPSSL